MGAEKQQPHELFKAKQREISLPYSDAKPSEVTDVYWIYAIRKREKYSKATPRSGKWLIFVDPENVDEVGGKNQASSRRRKIRK